MAKFFETPFAEEGDRSPIPDAIQPTGEVSFQQGYGYDYEREYDDPDHKLIERDETNQLYFLITEAIGEIQQLGAARWQLAAAPYPIGAQVFHGSGIWAAVVDNATQEPGTGNQWVRTPGRQDMTPIGVALPYFGALEDIPSNYRICNGENGTPNLTDRFIVGAGGTYARGQTGGSTETGLAGTHNHGISVAGHTLTEAEMPAHSHLMRFSPGPGRIDQGGASEQAPGTGGERNRLTDSAGGNQAHSHGASSANAGQHRHSAVPPFLAAVWIMRVS